MCLGAKIEKRLYQNFIISNITKMLKKGLRILNYAGCDYDTAKRSGV